MGLLVLNADKFLQLHSGWSGGVKKSLKVQEEDVCVGGARVFF